MSIAARVAAEKLSITVNVVQPRVDYIDTDGTWPSVAQIESDETILVRSDNYVAQRSRTDNAELASTAALAAILGKSY